MRKARWTFAGLLSLYVLIGLSGCRKEFLYNTIGIELENYDNSGSYLQLAGDTVDSDAYVLRINYASDLADYQTVDLKNNYKSNNQPVSIEVTVLQFYDSLHQANSSVMDCFIDGPGTVSPQHVVDAFQETSTSSPTHLPDDLWLMELPDTTGTFSFVVKMEFNDGVILRDTATVILD